MVALAILPALLLLVWLYTRDTLHPEPKRQVYRLYLLGAAIVLPAGLLERAMLNNSVHPVHNFIGQTLVTAFFIAGMVEEFLKAAIFDRAAYIPRRVRSPIDCIIYAGAVALGFATVENVLYVTSAGFSTAVLRSVTAVPAHLMFGIIMGSLFGRSLTTGANKAWAYLVPAVAHGVYDAFALSNSWLGDVLLVAYLIVLLEVALRRIDWAGSMRRRRSTPVTP